MKNKTRLSVIGMIWIVAFSGYACQDQLVDPVNSESESLSNTLIAEKGGSHAAGHHQLNFTAHLQGRHEVHEVDSDAQGQALFRVSRDGESIAYKLIVANIENVTMAHIHRAPVDVNGPVIVWLYPSAPPAQLIEGRFQGVLAEGVITADHLVGQLAGATIEDLIQEMRDGNTYVNVHTEQYPPGEIRGQIR